MFALSVFRSCGAYVRSEGGDANGKFVSIVNIVVLVVVVVIVVCSFVGARIGVRRNRACNIPVLANLPESIY